MEMQAVDHDPFVVPTQAVDHDPFAPGFEAVDHDPFADAVKFVDAERLSRVSVPSSSSDALYAGRFPSFPASTNIEDRRNEVGMRALLQSWTSLTPEDWANALKHPMTTRQELIKGLSGGDNRESQLAIDAGINDVGIIRIPVDHDPFAETQ